MACSFLHNNLGFLPHILHPSCLTYTPSSCPTSYSFSPPASTTIVLLVSFLSSFFMHHIRPDSSCPVHQIHALNISQFLILYVYPMERFSFLTIQLPTMHILHIPILSASISPFFLFKSNFPVLRSPILVYSLCIYKLYSSV